jgi:hypothetical protein
MSILAGSPRILWQARMKPPDEDVILAGRE